MRIEQQIQDMEQKLKALHYERDMNQAKCDAGTAAIGLGSSHGYALSPERWNPEFIRDVISYHQPGPDGLMKIGAVRLATENFIRALVDNCPDSADRMAAIRHAREAMMTANAAIVLNGRI